jgi:Pex2 / Pex12 amino terminal region
MLRSGPARRAQYQQLVQAIGSFLYLSLSTGRGVQTLGEEYCDLMQVTASGATAGALAVSTAAGPIRRWAQVLFESFGSLTQQWIVKALLRRFSSGL